MSLLRQLTAEGAQGGGRWLQSHQTRTLVLLLGESAQGLPPPALRSPPAAPRAEEEEAGSKEEGGEPK